MASKFCFVYSYANCVFAKPDNCVFTLKCGAQIKIWVCVWCERNDGLYLVVNRKGGNPDSMICLFSKEITYGKELKSPTS